MIPKFLLIIFFIAIAGVIVYALITGKILAGSRGLKANTYSRKDQPLLYYTFLVIYILIAIFIFSQT